MVLREPDVSEPSPLGPDRGPIVRNPVLNGYLPDVTIHAIPHEAIADVDSYVTVDGACVCVGMGAHGDYHADFKLLEV